MAKLRLLGVQEEVVQGVIISVSPPEKLCRLFAANGDMIAERVIQTDKAKAWAQRECDRVCQRVGPDEATRLGYDKPMELRIYE